MRATYSSLADPALQAVVVEQTPLRYAAGPDAATDRPAHVRAGSSLARVPGGIAVIQDDANFVAVVAPDGRVTAITLPADCMGLRQFDDHRGNKRRKLDLEACVSVTTANETLLMAFGSGSNDAREQIALVEWRGSSAPAVSAVHAPRLYAALRSAHEFAGSRLNIEGATQLGDRLRLFNRGNSAARGELLPVNATCDLDLRALLSHLRSPDLSAAPTPGSIVQYDLGKLGGVALGFTDATSWRGALLYSASAEDTLDAVDDGPVQGSAIGILETGGPCRWAALTLPDGNSYTAKVEGLLALGDTGDRLAVIVDADDPDVPSLLCTVELRGPWVHQRR